MISFKPRRSRRVDRVLKKYRISRKFLLETNMFNAHFYARTYLQNVKDLDYDAVLDEFILISGVRDTNPNEFFDTSYYREQYSDIRLGEQIPLLHYIAHGAAELRNPSPNFSTSWYLSSNPDIAASKLNPLGHFLQYGLGEGRLPLKPNPDGKIGRLAARYAAYGEASASTLVQMRLENPDVLRYFQPNTPINVFPDDRLNSEPRLNILLPSLQMKHASGGPNTAFIIGAMLARGGVSVRFIATDAPLEEDLRPIKSHIKKLSGFYPDDASIEFADASNRQNATPIGRNDVFFATAWWTAQMAKAAASMTHHSRFIYLIQDYETLFYGASENMIDSENTYSFDYFPVINSTFLRDHLVAKRVGRFSEDYFVQTAAVFDPAISSEFTNLDPGSKKKRVLFYARPTFAARNLFGLGIATLRAAIAAGIFDDGDWEFVGMGEPFEPVQLGAGHVLKPAPWLDFAGYAQLMRESQVLLSLMLSPHPSYPPLEMAAAGGVAVTTIYGTKTTSALSAISPNILGVAADIPSLVEGLYKAVNSTSAASTETERFSLPRSWTEALAPVLPSLFNELSALGIERHQLSLGFNERDVSIFRSEIGRESETNFAGLLEDRRRSNARVRDTPRLSVVTFISGTDFEIDGLGRSVLGQSPRWVVDWSIAVVGGASKKIVSRISGRRGVRICEVASYTEGLSWAIANSEGEYIVVVPAGGILFPDAIHTVACFLLRAGKPPMAFAKGICLHNEECRPKNAQVISISKDAAASLIADGREVESISSLVQRAMDLAATVAILDGPIYLDLSDTEVFDSALRDIDALHAEEHKEETMTLIPVNTSSSISILTVLYHGSDADLFRKTAESVRLQSRRAQEWIVLAQGAISDELEKLVVELASDGLLTLLRTTHNRGIAKGLRNCLEVASGQMAFWLDGDDLLAPNAIEELVSAQEKSPNSVIFYTDEDILVDERRQSPIFRPDFDPALVLSHSYIYHLIMFNTKLALELEAFTSHETQYAQDWDIVVRFFLAGHRPLHISQILVHWRHHAKSTSNSGAVFSGSLESIKGVFSHIIANSFASKNYEVVPYPLKLGVPDYFIKRCPINPPDMRLIEIGPRKAVTMFPYSSISRMETLDVAELKYVVAKVSEDLVFLCNTSLYAIQEQGIWQAIKHFELIPSCVAVGGPIADPFGKVIYGGLVVTKARSLADPQSSQSIADPGPFSLHLKPHCVGAVAVDMIIARTQFIREALEGCPANIAFLSLPAWLGAFASSRGCEIVYEPLLRAQSRRSEDLFSDDIEGLNVALTYPIAQTADSARWKKAIRGTAGFMSAAASTS